MTLHDDIPVPPAPERYAVLDALLDGEPVDKMSLRAALDDTEARDYFVDALSMRQLTRDMAPLTFSAPGRTQPPLVRRLRWLAAGVVFIAGTGGAYVLGQRSSPPPVTVESVVTFDSQPM